MLAAAQASGAIGPGALASHIDHASAFVDVVELVAADATCLLDLGSGGGLPGLVVADRRPDLCCTLLDGRTERVRRLAAAADQLGWTARVTPVAERAELAAHREALRHRFDVVVARSFGAPAVTAECAVGFLRRGGVLIVSEPPDREPRWPADGCATLGLVPLALPPLARPFAALMAADPCDARFPRRTGVPAKRPLF